MVQIHSTESAAADTPELLVHWFAFGLGCVAFIRAVAVDAFEGASLARGLWPPSR